MASSAPTASRRPSTGSRRASRAARWSGYAYTGDIDENRLLPTAVGVPRPSAVVPETMAGGDLRDAAPVCVVGFRTLKDFHPALAADGLRRAGHEARATELELKPEDRADSNALGFARAFDQPAFRGEVVAQVGARLRAGERVAFPAVLGIADPHGAWSALERALGRPVFEIPTLPPSVPGMRVFAVLREALRRAGGRVLLNNVVVGAEHEGGRVRALRTRVGLREERRGADWVVLATGGFSAGGIALDSHWTARETRAGPARDRRPGGRRGALPARTTSTTIPSAARASRWTRSSGRSTRAASACSRTSWSPARRWPAPSRGARSPATASASRPGIAPPS